MTLIVAVPELAKRLSRLLVGDVRYVVAVADEKELRHRVHEHQPDVVLLGWAIGGNRWRAIDEVTAIVERTATHPYVIAILPQTSPAIEREAAKKGCYDVVSVDAEDFDRQVVEAVETARKARAARRPLRRRVAREDLH